MAFHFSDSFMDTVARATKFLNKTASLAPYYCAEMSEQLKRDIRSVEDSYDRFNKKLDIYKKKVSQQG